MKDFVEKLEDMMAEALSQAMSFDPASDSAYEDGRRAGKFHALREVIKVYKQYERNRSI